jgi:hypothetical protein
VDDVAAGHSPTSDAALLAGLKGRHGPVWHLALAVLWAAGSVAQLVTGHPVLAALWGMLGAGWVVQWWVGRTPSLREVTDDALVVRTGLLRTRSIPRSDIEDVRASYGSGYGLVLGLRGAEPVTLAGTALRHSVAAAQAAALRRWAGLEQ